MGLPDRRLNLPLRYSCAGPCDVYEWIGFIGAEEIEKSRMPEDPVSLLAGDLLDHPSVRCLSNQEASRRRGCFKLLRYECDSHDWLLRDEIDECGPVHSECEFGRHTQIGGVGVHRAAWAVSIASWAVYGDTFGGRIAASPPSPSRAYTPEPVVVLGAVRL